MGEELQVNLTEIFEKVSSGKVENFKFWKVQTLKSFEEVGLIDVWIMVFKYNSNEITVLLTLSSSKF
jgi:hypothetical protein